MVVTAFRLVEILDVIEDIPPGFFAVGVDSKANPYNEPTLPAKSCPPTFHDSQLSSDRCWTRRNRRPIDFREVRARRARQGRAASGAPERSTGHRRKAVSQQARAATCLSNVNQSASCPWANPSPCRENPDAAGAKNTPRRQWPPDPRVLLVPAEISRGTQSAYCV